MQALCSRIVGSALSKLSEFESISLLSVSGVSTSDNILIASLFACSKEIYQRLWTHQLDSKCFWSLNFMLFMIITIMNNIKFCHFRIRKLHEILLLPRDKTTASSMFRIKPKVPSFYKTIDVTVPNLKLEEDL